VEIYLRKMMPVVKRRSDNALTPLQIDFETVMTLMGVGVDDNGNPLPQNERQKAYQRELLGSRVIEGAPFLYWDTLTMLESGAVAEWGGLPVRTRARIKAALQIKNMAQVIERHRDTQAQKAEKMGKV